MARKRKGNKSSKKGISKKGSAVTSFSGGANAPKNLFSVGSANKETSSEGSIQKSAGFNVTQTNSFFYSPELTTESWLLPKSRQEILKWVRIFFNLEPYIQSITMMHALYPFSKFDIVTSDPSITQFYKDMAFNEEFNLLKFVTQASLSYNKFGEALCFGNMEQGEDKLWRWKKFILLEPELVEVRQDMLSGMQEFELIPTEDMKALVLSQKPEDLERKKALMEQSPEVINAILEHRNIRLENDNISIIARITDPAATRGTSPIQSCFKVLIYQDWIRLAQSAFAQRYIFPIEHWTVGDLAQNIIPDEETLEQYRDLIKQSIQNPPFSIITPPILKYEPLSTLGKQFPINNEYDYIQDQLLIALGVNKNIILGEGPSFCLSDDSRIMTKDGLKGKDEISESDEILTLNPETDQYEYQKPLGIYKFPFHGYMTHFKTGMVDHLVTPNHRMWAKQRDADTWEFVEAKDVKPRSHVRVLGEWGGNKQAEYTQICGESVPTKSWFKFMGYWISEGWGNGYLDKRRNKTAWRLGIGQSHSSDCLDDILDMARELPFKHGEYDYQSKYISKKTNSPVAPMTSLVWCNKELTQHVISEAGQNSYTKHIPSWMKNADKEHLQILFDALMKGDGSERPATLKTTTTKVYYTYNTVSKQLADDVCEIALKLGYIPSREKYGNKYVVYCSDSDQNRNGIHSLESKSVDEVISPVWYEGDVWCVEVPNHIFMSERNGKFVLTGNSNTKTMALHKLMMVYKTIRDEFEDWMIYKFFKPIAEKNNFYTTENGKKKLILPEISWYKSLDIEEQEAERDRYLDLHKSGYISTETLFSKFPNLEYTTEQKRLEKEQGTVWDKGDERIPGKITKPTSKPSGGGSAGSSFPAIRPIEPVSPVPPEETGTPTPERGGVGDEDVSPEGPERVGPESPEELPATE